MIDACIFFVTISFVILVCFFSIYINIPIDDSKYDWSNCNNTQKLLLIFLSGPLGWVLYPIVLIVYFSCVYLNGLFDRVFDAAGKVDIQIKKGE